MRHFVKKREGRASGLVVTSRLWMLRKTESLARNGGRAWAWCRRIVLVLRERASSTPLVRGSAVRRWASRWRSPAKRLSRNEARNQTKDAPAAEVQRMRRVGSMRWPGEATSDGGGRREMAYDPVFTGASGRRG